MDQQNVIETFFYMLGQFAFDRAKSYVEAKKEWLQKSSPASSCPFVYMLSTFAQLAEAEKFYHNHPFITQSHSSFLPSRHFLRKERSLKDVYEDVRLELQRIEARPKKNRLEAEFNRKSSTSDAMTISMMTNSQQRFNQSISSATQDNPTLLDRQSNMTSSSNLSTRQTTANNLTNNNIDRSGSASPRPPSLRSTIQAPLNDNASDNHELQSPNKFSPFFWFSISNSKQKNSTNQFHKPKQNKYTPTTSVSRRLFSDTSCDAAAASNKVATSQSKSDSEFAPKTDIVSGYTIGILEEAQWSAQSSSRQILSPSISSPLQQLQASNSNIATLQAHHSVAPPPPPTVTTSNSIIVAVISEELMSHFCLQLQYYTQARLELISIYEKLFEVAGKKHVQVDGISIQISIFCRKYQKYFHHPLLAPIKEGMTLECEVLMTLIRATIDIQHWRFLTSVFDLQEAQQKLNYWAANTFNKEISKRRFNVKAQPIPRLYDWLCKFREFLVAKFTIYFHSTLYKNLPANTIKNTCTKLSIDFYQRLSHFQRKVDALFIAMLFDVTNEKDYRGQGYHLSTATFDQPKGKNTLQTMLVIPADAKAKLENLQAELFMIVAGQSQALDEGQFQLFDPSKQLAYFLTKPDSHVVLIVTVEGQRPDRETIIKTLSEITNQLSGNRVIMSLSNNNAKSPQR